MSDISRNSADLPTVIVGATTAGVPTTPVGSDSNGNLNVNAQVVAAPTDLSASGSLTSTSSSVSLSLNGQASLNVDVSGTFVGTITVLESSTSGGHTLYSQLSGNSAFQTTITSVGNYRVVGLPANGTVSVQFSSYTSGTAVISMRASTAPFFIESYQLNPVNLLSTSYLNDGTGNPITSTNGGLNVSAVSAADTFTVGNITAQDTGSTPTTGFNGQVWYSGTPTSGSVFSVSTAGIETGMVEISGTWTGTVQTEISVDGGVNWIQHSIHQIGSADFVSTYTGNVAGSINLAGKTNFRVRAVAPITGTVVVRLIESQNASNIYVANAIKLLDGSSATSSTTMNIAPASTAAASTNTAVVVGLSPNSPLPAGTNSLGTVSSKTQDGSGNSIVSYNSQLSTDDIINTSISSGSITVGTTAVAARVSGSNLTNRKMLMISPVNNIVYMGASSSITTATGTPIYPGQVVSFAFSANVTPYLISSSSGAVNIFEGA